MGFRGHALTDVVKGFGDIAMRCAGRPNVSKLDTFMQQHLDEIRSSQQFNCCSCLKIERSFGEMKKRWCNTLLANVSVP